MRARKHAQPSAEIPSASTASGSAPGKMQYIIKKKMQFKVSIEYKEIQIYSWFLTNGSTASQNRNHPV